MSDRFITGLTLYPVKSCAGINVSQWDLEGTGLSWDRRFMVVHAEGEDKGVMVSQRDFPAMARLVPTLDVAGNTLHLQGEGVDLDLPLKDERQRTALVRVWRSLVPAWDMGREAADALSTYLGTPVQLVRFPEDHQRQVNPERTGNDEAFTAFADGYPLLVIGEASLADLNIRLRQKGAMGVPMDRFRPNIVVRGLHPYQEDQLSRVGLGRDGALIRMVKPCTRCSMTTLDQLEGAPGSDPKEPLATLSEYRRWDQGGIIFGQNAIVLGGGTLKIGDPFEVIDD